MDDKEMISKAMSLLSKRRPKENCKGKPPKNWTCPLCGGWIRTTLAFRAHLRESHDLHWRFVILNGELLPNAEINLNAEMHRKRLEVRREQKSRRVQKKAGKKKK
jgi:hypothetical protein